MVMLGKICANFHETFHSRKKKKKGKGRVLSEIVLVYLMIVLNAFEGKFQWANILLEEMTRLYFCEKT